MTSLEICILPTFSAKRKKGGLSWPLPSLMPYAAAAAARCQWADGHQ